MRTRDTGLGKKGVTIDRCGLARTRFPTDFSGYLNTTRSARYWLLLWWFSVSRQGGGEDRPRSSSYLLPGTRPGARTTGGMVAGRYPVRYPSYA